MRALDVYGEPMLTTREAARRDGGKMLPDGYVRFGPVHSGRPSCDLCGPFASRDMRWMAVGAEWRCYACDQDGGV